MASDRTRVESCETCYFWEPIEHSENYEGECHRYPPQLVNEVVVQAQESAECQEEATETANCCFCWFQPVTTTEGWCGEYRQKGAQ